jgi:hypothetical protein
MISRRCCRGGHLSLARTRRTESAKSIKRVTRLLSNLMLVGCWFFDQYVVYAKLEDIDKVGHVLQPPMQQCGRICSQFPALMFTGRNNVSWKAAFKSHLERLCSVLGQLNASTLIR